MKKRKKTVKKIGKIASGNKTVKKVGDHANTIGTFIIEYRMPLLIASGAVLGWYIIKGARKQIASVFEDQSEHVAIDLGIDKQNTTISETQAQQFAQQLLDASNHKEPLYGTDEKTIKQVFLQLKTPEDFKLVYKAFGNKNYNGWNSPPTGIFRYLDNYEPRDLVYWLKSEVKPSDGQVYTIVKARIQSAGWEF